MGLIRKNRQTGGFWLSLLINLLLNLEWSIPAWICLGLHFWWGISIWWFVGAVAFWLLCILSGMWIMSWAAKCGNEPTPDRPNKNPYSKCNPKSERNE